MILLGRHVVYVVDARPDDVFESLELSASVSIVSLLNDFLCLLTRCIHIQVSIIRF